MRRALQLDDPADAVARVVEVAPGDRVTIRIVAPRREPVNLYGVFADRPIGLDLEDLDEVRREMWSSFGAGGD
jgi:hypothetical protein